MNTTKIGTQLRDSVKKETIGDRINHLEKTKRQFEAKGKDTTKITKEIESLEGLL